MRRGFFISPAPGECAAASGREPGSFGSWPAMARRIRSQSSAPRAMGPILSMEKERAMAPARLTRPNVGGSPLRPQNPEGHRMEPQVSVPMAKPARPAPTTAAEPLDDPQVQCFSFQGFFAGPVAEAEAKR